MKFMLTVSRKSGIVASQTQLGTNALDIARMDSGLPNLPADLVWNAANGQNQAYFEISEELARRSGQFKECSSFCVTAKSLPLQLKCHVNREDDGRVISVGFHMCLDESEFLRQWESAGFPAEMTDECIDEATSNA